MKKKCSQCGSEDLLEGLRVVDQGDHNYRRELEIEMDIRPDAIFMRGTSSTTVQATMCCVCGNVMLFASPAFAANLKEIGKLRTESGKLGDPTKHPLYKDFLKSDPVNKHLELSDQISAFVRWMRKQRPQD